jgi:hypothetical protein
MANYWLPIENEWLSLHEEKLFELREACEKTHLFVAEIAQHTDFISRPVSSKITVQRMLLRRLGEELRGVELLVLNGHGYQALSAAANLFEQSHFLTYVSSSTVIAEQFLGWNNPAKSIANVKDVVTASGRLRGWDTPRIEAEYKKYRFLCGFKHNNALMQRFLGLGTDPDLVLGQLALVDSIWFVLCTTGLLAVSALSSAATVEAITKCNIFMSEVEVLYSKLEATKAATYVSSDNQKH